MIIDRYIAAEIARPFAVGTGLLFIVFVGYSSIMQLAEVEKGLLPLTTALQLIFLKSIVSLEIILPTALYLSVLSAMGRLVGDSEMVALHATGISELRILTAVLKVAFFIALLVGLISLFGRPWAYRESYRIEADAVAALDIGRLEARRFLELQNGSYVLFAQRVVAVEGRLFDLFMQRDRSDGANVIYAREARLFRSETGTGLVMSFHDGYSYLLDREGDKDSLLRFNRLAINLERTPADTGYKRKAEPIFRLARSERRRDVAEFQWRLSTPLATLLLAALAVPLSRHTPRRSRFGGYFIAISIYVLLFNLALLARNLVEQGFVGPVPGIWWAYLFLLLLLMVLLSAPRWNRFG